MTRLTEADLKSFQQAVYKDYGVMIPDKIGRASCRERV